MATTQTALDAVTAELKEAMRRRDEIEQATKKAVEHGRAQLREAQAEIRRLERARAALTGEKTNGKPRRELVPATVAGPAAVKTVETLLREEGTLSQAEVTKQTKLNSGTVSYALKALEERGTARKTGEYNGRSPLWEFTGVRTGTPVPA